MRPRAASLVVLVLVCVAALVAGCGQSQPTTSAARSSPPPQARTPAAATTPTPHRFHSIAMAVHFIDEHVRVPVVLPSNLPVATRLAADPIVSAAGAQLPLALPHRRLLTIQYGKATFDGCGPLHPRSVKVAGRPAVIETFTSHGRPFTTLVWPATLKHLEGRYGLSGPFTASQILAFANSMQHPRTETPRGPTNGC